MADAVVVHSSLSSIGWMDGGAETVIAAALDVLGSDGLLVLPTFNFSVHPFDVELTPSKMGAISEAGRLHKEAIRSWHPSHSVAAIGPRAGQLVWRHIENGATGVGSPLDRVAKWGGWVLLLGVTHTTNTTIHVGETYSDFPGHTIGYSPISPKSVAVITPGRHKVHVTLTAAPGCSQRFGAIDAVVRERGQIVDGRVGDARCLLMRGQHIIDAAMDMMSTNPRALMCADPLCGQCGPTDLQLAEWDALLP
jgi:aminoglycoside 3-N-acetyltransferase